MNINNIIFPILLIVIILISLLLCKRNMNVENFYEEGEPKVITLANVSIGNRISRRDDNLEEDNFYKNYYDSVDDISTPNDLNCINKDIDLLFDRKDVSNQNYNFNYKVYEIQLPRDDSQPISQSGQVVAESFQNLESENTFIVDKIVTKDIVNYILNYDDLIKIYLI